MPNYANPQSLNRYSYVNNSPLNYTDPSGHVACQTQEDCLDMGTTPGGGFPHPQPDRDDDENDDGGGGGDPCAIHPEACGIFIPNLDPETSQGTPLASSGELTNAQLIGQGLTFFLIETILLLPVDYALVELTVDAGAACVGGAVPACIAEVPILAVDLIVADFQVSLANTIAQNVATGTQHEFEWVIIPALISTLPESAQHNIYNTLPWFEVKDD